MSSALAGIRKSPAAPLLPGHAGHGLVGFQLCGLSVVCGLCRASILAGLAGMQGYASPLRSPGPSFPSAVIFRSFVRSGFAASPCNSVSRVRQAAASLRPCIPALSPGFYGGTAPPGVAEHVTMEDSGMSVVAPAVYVGTWHKYNCGSIAGRWFDLTTFDDESDFFAACRALHQDEADPELMFQDYEGFPGNMASECHINWAWVEGFRRARDEGCEEAYRLWVDDTGETDFDSFRDAWWGEADSEEALRLSSPVIPACWLTCRRRWRSILTMRRMRGIYSWTPSPLLTVMCSVGDLLPARRGYGLPGRRKTLAGLRLPEMQEGRACGAPFLPVMV